MSIRRWYALHKWTSLVCSVFLLLLCLTGLPLVFADEIDQWTDPHVYETLPSASPPVSLDRLVDLAHRMYPGQIVTSVNIDDDEPQAWVWMGPSFAALKRHPKLEHFVRFDTRTARVLDESKPANTDDRSFMTWMFRLHTDLFAGLAGELFLAAMALCFIAALVSGVVLYEPFMKKLDFGTLRRRSSARLRWLDMHNLLGIATVAWMTVVGVTGLFNELSTPLFALWQRTHVEPMSLAGHDAIATASPVTLSVEGVADTVRLALPGMTVISVNYPGAEGGSPWHFFVWTHGANRLSKRLYTPALVDARSGALTAVITMPWYLRALELSRPLHFGDYAGLPLKLLWVVLDLTSIVVLVTGLYLWLARRGDRAARLARIEAAHARMAVEAAVHE
ncbi:MAG TPA: PepSY domain-containing protein [Rhodanobacter sp.]